MRASARLIAVPAMLIALASCVAPTRTVSPPAPPPVVAPTAPPPVAADWRDAPLTPGEWIYAGGAARFGVGEFSLRCDMASRTVVLVRAGAPSATPRTLGVTTTEGGRSFALTDQSEGAAAALPARDPFLDRMAFSRGRIAVATTGLPRLLLPVRAEIGRVVEDCRA